MTPDLLAEAADPWLVKLWSAHDLVYLERRIWIEVLRHQAELAPGLIPDGALHAYMRAVADINLASIERRERRTRHDVKARIEEYNELAGFQCIHLGLTSADVVEYCYSLRMQWGLNWLCDQHPDECPELARVASSLPFRGLKGAVGTQQDLADLLGKEGAQELDCRVARSLGVENLLGAVGQVPPRSTDLRVVEALVTAVAPTARGGAYRHVLNGFLTMTAGYCGDSWNEGDVSSSAVRRYALPGAFYAADICLRS